MQPSPTGPQPHQPSPPQSPGQSPSGPSAQQRSNVGKLFVGQVPYIATEELLQPLFAPYGSLQEIKIMRDPEGRSRGCAWVRYETQEQAQQAIEALHDKHTIPPQTNMLQVRFAQTSRPENGSGGGRGFGGGRGGYNNSRGGFNQGYQQGYQNQHYPQQAQSYYAYQQPQQQGYVAYQNTWNQSAAGGYGRGGAQQTGYGYQQQQSYPQQQVLPQQQQRYAQGEQPQMYATFASQQVYQPQATAVNQW